MAAQDIDGVVASNPGLGKRRNSVVDVEPIRKSRRLQEKASRSLIRSTKAGHSNVQPPKLLPSPSTSQTPPEASEDNRKRKAALREQNPDQPLSTSQTPPEANGNNRKRKAALLEENPDQPPASSEPQPKRFQKSGGVVNDRIDHWVRNLRWPKGDFEATPAMPPKKRSRSASLQDQQSTAVPETPSDQLPREAKAAPYADTRYEVLLGKKNSFMMDSEAGMMDAEKQRCTTWLNAAHVPPADSLFDDKYFRKTFEQIRAQNEQRVIRDITLLIVPSAEILTTRGCKELGVLIETTNAGWNRSIPVLGPRPQPDYSVGFRDSAFSQEQLKKLNIQPIQRDHYTATETVYFPFFTCEVKCANQALVVADRQNAHSMTIAVRGVVELYRAVNRQGELHRKVLAFSVSHEVDNVKIFAHYPEIEGSEVKYYRHLIMTCHVFGHDGRDRWGPYQFVRNVYENFVPDHLARIKSGINDLPDPLQSVPTAMSVDTEAVPGSVNTATTPASKDSGVFKKPAPRMATGAVATELARLTQMLEEQRKELAQEREKAEKERAWLMELLEEQRKQVKQEREKTEQALGKAERDREKAEQERSLLMQMLQVRAIMRQETTKLTNHFRSSKERAVSALELEEQYEKAEQETDAAHACIGGAT